MPIQAKYSHTNLIARDWCRLAAFYEGVFDCVPIPPERDFRGPDLDTGTGLHGVRLQGIHLRLPGWGEDGPTLELFNYSELADAGRGQVNRPGLAHIAFSVADVEAAREAVLAAGGSAVGEVVTLTIATGAQVTWCYVADPEGNIIELQTWL